MLLLMLLNDGKEGQRASWDWISFRLSRFVLLIVKFCTFNSKLFIGQTAADFKKILRRGDDF